MNINFIATKCRKCKITLSDFEVKEKNSLCLDCYKEEHDVVDFKVEKPRRLKNKRVSYSA